uniref:Uncharacterized protein n=1 Tax=Coccidioides posadasii RMSCC 3488 TaxID=454284 RepID=A0A0J6HXS8_COCPO|nr:hypothetical protein CPAG_00110 [Coccidioides posadasii RMSCC 3488]
MIRERPISPEGVYSHPQWTARGSFVERREEPQRPPLQVRRLHEIHGVAAPEAGPEHALANDKYKTMQTMERSKGTSTTRSTRLQTPGSPLLTPLSPRRIPVAACWRWCGSVSSSGSSPNFPLSPLSS